MAENFFSIRKTACNYRHKPTSFCEVNELLARYIYFYNRERIQLKLGVAPLTLRHSPYNFTFPNLEAFLCCPHNLGRVIMLQRLLYMGETKGGAL